MVGIARHLTRPDLGPASAKLAGLRYSTGAEPGYHRQANGHGFKYLDPAGRVVRDSRKLARFESLRLPPAWTDAWICRFERGHLQATGCDARGRKQFRYHEQWRGTRDRLKYDRMIAFAEAPPPIRRHVTRQMRRPRLTRDKVLAAMVRLLDQTHIRVGGEQYERENGSFGLATIKDRHAAVYGAHLLLRFRARLAKIVRCAETWPARTCFSIATKMARCAT